jgi:7-carboxy-7-deazaguanine synthase
MTYAVKEIFYSLQGEGARTGRAAVFLRFAGCNLWSGREADRPQAVCRFCDTDFVGTVGSGGGRFSDASALASAVLALWPKGQLVQPYVVCTGGEPLLPLDAAAIAALHDAGFEIAVETNGPLAAPSGIEWICVSPKAGAPLKQTTGQELKLVYPQADAAPERFAGLSFDHFFLQPMDGPDRAAGLRAAAAYCMEHPQWRLSLQIHKIAGFR